MIMGLMEFRSGTVAQFHDDFNVRVGQTRLELIGAEGRLVAVDCLSGRPAGSLAVETAAGTRALAVVHGDPYAAVVRDLHAAVESGATPASSGMDDRAALAGALAAMRSAERGMRVEIDRAA